MKDEKYGAGEILLAIQQEIVATKSKVNTFGKFNYRSCEDILVALKPILAKHNATIYLTDSVHTCGDNMPYVNAKAVFMIIGQDDMKLTAQAQAGIGPVGGMSISQQFGSASSYARKYALAGLLLLDDNKDDDTRSNIDIKETAKAIIDDGGI
tara:strand:+ start:223 stop:681 length:459 start_codon:yes stop_codon:yes gene_type:complete